MSQIIAQPLEAQIVTTTIRVEITAAVTTTTAQPLGRAVAGASQTAIISPA